MCHCKIIILTVKYTIVGWMPLTITPRKGSGGGEGGVSKEDIKEQPTPRNLSATARRVLRCTWPIAASRKYFSAIGALFCCQCSE
jgi:hypothetical protein